MVFVSLQLVASEEVIDQFNEMVKNDFVRNNDVDWAKSDTDYDLLRQMWKLSCPDSSVVDTPAIIDRYDVVEYWQVKRALTFDEWIEEHCPQDKCRRNDGLYCLDIRFQLVRYVRYNSWKQVFTSWCSHHNFNENDGWSLRIQYVDARYRDTLSYWKKEDVMFGEIVFGVAEKTEETEFLEEINWDKHRNYPRNEDGGQRLNDIMEFIDEEWYIDLQENMDRLEDEHLHPYELMHRTYVGKDDDQKREIQEALNEMRSMDKREIQEVLNEMRSMDDKDMVQEALEQEEEDVEEWENLTFEQKQAKFGQLTWNDEDEVWIDGDGFVRHTREQMEENGWIFSSEDELKKMDKMIQDIQANPDSDEEETIDLEQFRCTQDGKYKDKNLLVCKETGEIYTLDEDMDIKHIGTRFKNSEEITWNEEDDE